MYEEFKRELYYNIKQCEEAKGKCVRLLEPKMICADSECIQMIRYINFVSYGYADIMIREDILAVSCETHMEESENAFADSVEQGTDAKLKYWRIQDLYKRFLKEGWQCILPEIVLQLQQMGGMNAKTTIWAGTYEQNRYRHIIRPLNYYCHREELENCIYWRYGDIALVLYMVIYDMPEDCMTLKLNRSMTDGWGLSDATLLTNALLNSRKMMTPRLYHGDALRRNLGNKAGIFLPEDGRISVFIDAEDEMEGILGYRLTTSKWFNGAVALFYPCVKESLAEMMGGDYFVGFTSVHEAVIHPVRHKILNEMKAAILQTNAIHEEREMLTNCVYRYCAAKKMLLEV